jgi:hypothetical protein
MVYGGWFRIDGSSLLIEIQTMTWLVMLNGPGDQDEYNLLVVDETSIVWVFAELSRLLGLAGYVEKVAKSSRGSGQCVMNRYMNPEDDMPEDEEDEEEDEEEEF